MSKIEIAGRCPHCNQAHPALTGQGISILIVEFEIGLLEALFDGELDDFKCDACNRPTGVRPTVEFISEDPLACYLVFGTLALPYCDDVIEKTRTFCLELSPNLEPQIQPSMDALRDVVRNQLLNNIDKLNKGVTEPDGDVRMGALAQLDARHFAAVKVALGCPQAHIHIGCAVEGFPLQGEAIIDQLAQYQARSWIALWWSRYRAGKSAPNLDDQLARRFYEAVILPGAADQALEMLAQIEQSGLSMSFPAEYCLQALRASICALAEGDNPQSDGWTVLFFKAEMTLRLGNEASKAVVQPLILSEERARATVPFQDAWDVVAKILAGGVPPPEVFDALDEIAIKVGHPELRAEVATTLNIVGTKPLTADDIAKILRTALDELGVKPELLGTMLRQSTKGLIDAGLIDELERLAEETIALVPNSPPVRADVYAWLGSALKQLRAPQRFLDLIGPTIQDWERSLAPEQQAPLWTERSNTLRMVGRADEALSTIEDVLEIMRDQKDGADYGVARLNHAILLRETGAPDLSVTELEELLSLPAVKGDLRIGVLDSLAKAYHRMGRTVDMVHCYEQSLMLAVGPFSDRVTASRSNLAAALVADDRYDDAIALLSELDPQIGADPTVLFSAASAWLTILSNTKGVPKRAFNRGALIAALSQCAKRAKENDNIQDWLGALRLLGSFAELSGNRRIALDIWETVAQICDEYDQQLSPIELLPLARYAYLDDDNNLAYDCLLQLPRAVAAYGGRATDIAAVALSLEPTIRRGLDELVLIAKDKAKTFAEIRLIAEMRRDVVSRSQRYLLGNLSAVELAVLEEGFSDEVLAALAPISGRVGVLEWIDCPGWIACFVTVIDSAGEVHTHMLDYPEIDIAKLAEKMDTLLRAWYQARPGDPFDIPEWCELEAWLIRVLAPHLQDGDHLVIFEHGRFAGLPWHVAAAPYWSCSYAGAWTSLLTLPDRVGPKPATKCLGVAFVPCFRESDDVLTSFQQSLAHSKALAGQLGLTLVTRVGEACDRDGLVELLAQVDVCKLLCHGFASSSGQGVDLMLAHDGALPPADPFAAESAVARKHRFGWRDGRHLTASSPVLFSAACSTGLAHVVGVGERVGLLSGLRNAGTQTLIAPRWDAVATSVLPILDDALQRYLGGMTLATAVRTACREAHARGPRWLAWTLCIEGDWR